MAVLLGRAHTRRCVAGKLSKPCQQASQGRSKGRGRDKSVWNGRVFAHSEVLTDGDGGDAEFLAGSLGALGRSRLGQNMEGSRAFSRGKRRGKWSSKLPQSNEIKSDVFGWRRGVIWGRNVAAGEMLGGSYLSASARETRRAGTLAGCFVACGR